MKEVGKWKSRAHGMSVWSAQDEASPDCGNALISADTAAATRGSEPWRSLLSRSAGGSAKAGTFCQTSDVTGCRRPDPETDKNINYCVKK
jgi:hypothetical protein